MGLRASSIEAVGRAAAEKLDAMGEHQLANDVRLLVNSNLGLRKIARQFHADMTRRSIARHVDNLRTPQEPK